VAKRGGGVKFKNSKEMGNNKHHANGKTIHSYRVRGGARERRAMGLKSSRKKKRGRETGADSWEKKRRDKKHRSTKGERANEERVGSQAGCNGYKGGN